MSDNTLIGYISTLCGIIAIVLLLCITHCTEAQQVLDSKRAITATQSSSMVQQAVPQPVR